MLVAGTGLKLFECLGIFFKFLRGLPKNETVIFFLFLFAFFLKDTM